MKFDSAFSRDYTTARNRFLKSSRQLTDAVTAYPVLNPVDDLSIDVAVIGDLQASYKLVISSGLHGIEGFVGSAIQLALLEKLINRKIRPVDFSLVLIHGVNPYGFKHLRRVNEDNIDLNRNFLIDFSQLPDAAGYAEFHDLLNPESMVSGVDFFSLKACYYICRYGLRSLRHSIAAGQYDYPKGLFYGGSCPAQSTGIIREILLDLSAGGNKICHIDIHSGLGRYADYRLLLSNKQTARSSVNFESVFDTEKLEIIGTQGGVTSPISGTICDYFYEMIGESYFHLGLEFGTYSNFRLLKAMRIENAAHHYLNDTNADIKKIKAELLECFCPLDPQWRNTVVNSGLEVIDQAIRYIR